MKQQFLQVKKQRLALDTEQQSDSKLGKEYVKAIYGHPAYLIYKQNTSCDMLGWMHNKLESRLPGEISIISDTQIMAESEEELKSLLMKVKEESEKAGKTQHSKSEDHGIQSHHSWQTDGETMEIVRSFIFGDSKISADGDCSHEIKRRLLLFKGKKKSSDQSRQHIKKQRHCFANKGPSSQSNGFSSGHVWM